MFQRDLLQIILTIPAILIAFTFHEYAHAVVADRLGDKTPKFQGRLTLNPIAHIDIIGFLLILVAGFGWAKPVQTNPSAYKHYYKDDLKVSAAGPVANLLVALVFSILLGAYVKILDSLGVYENVHHILFLIIQYVIQINIMLFFFNLIPLPGLDGFHILRDIFPKFFYNIADQLYRYQMIILIIFIATPLARYIVGVPTNFVLDLMLKFASAIAR